VKSKKIPSDALDSKRIAPSKHLLKPTKKFFLLIEGERVGPFVQTGGKRHLAQILRNRGIVIEIDSPRSDKQI